MSVEAPLKGAQGVGSLKEYERKLRASMMLMGRATRENVIREIVTGVEEQVRAAGGDFARVAPSLDDPKWVGGQMVKVYGISSLSKSVFVAAGAGLAAVSVPSPLFGDSALATLGPLLAFGLLVLCTFLAVSIASVRLALATAAVACAVRVFMFFAPLGGYLAPIDLASRGELTLFAAATVMLVLVAAFPALVSRRSEG